MSCLTIHTYSAPCKGVNRKVNYHLIDWFIKISSHCTLYRKYIQTYVIMYALSAIHGCISSGILLWRNLLFSFLNCVVWFIVCIMVGSREDFISMGMTILRNEHRCHLYNFFFSKLVSIRHCKRNAGLICSVFHCGYRELSGNNSQGCCPT